MTIFTFALWWASNVVRAPIWWGLQCGGASNVVEPVHVDTVHIG